MSHGVTSAVGRPAKRSGFTLLELITAMLASTVLIGALAATIVVSTQLLAVPPSDETVWHDRYIADRLASDLRYATSVTDGVGYGFEITKPNPDDGSQQTATYQSHEDGMTRQVGSGPIMNLDPEAPSHQFTIDGYSAPTDVQSGSYVRLRSFSTATTPTVAASVEIDVPPSCKTGDLIMLCISAKTLASLSVSEPGWQTLQNLDVNELRLIAIHRSYDNSWPSTITVSASSDVAMAVAMLAFENVDPSSPVDWTGAGVGYALTFLPFTLPTPLESSGFGKRQLNVQVFAADSDPWHDGAFGMAGFTDTVQVTAARGDASIRNTLGIVIRNGATPDLSMTPHSLHQENGFWLQAAVRLEVKP